MSTMIEPGKRAVACQHWRWMPGMLVRGINPENGQDSWLRIVEFHHSKTHGQQADTLDDHWPDLTDPATVGCLLHLVREAWGDGGVYAVRYKNLDRRSRWLVSSVHLYHSTKHSHGDTEAEALVKALEAAND